MELRPYHTNPPIYHNVATILNSYQIQISQNLVCLWFIFLLAKSFVFQKDVMDEKNHETVN